MLAYMLRLFGNAFPATKVALPPELAQYVRAEAPSRPHERDIRFRANTGKSPKSRVKKRVP